MPGAPERAPLTAKQVDVPGHATPSRVPTPDGSDSTFHVDPPFEVPIAIGLPNIPKPTATHDDAVIQAMLLSSDTLVGMKSRFQEFPPSLDEAIESDPTDIQLLWLVHATESKVLMPNGTGRDDHDKPPFEVLMITEPLSVFPLLPTEIHTSSAPHEMPSSETAFEGTVSLAHVNPVSDVPTT